MVPRSVISHRKVFARDYVQKEIANGRRIADLAALRNVLLNVEGILALETGFFDVLSSEDLINLLLEVVNAGQSPESTPRTASYSSTSSLSSTGLNATPAKAGTSSTDLFNVPEDVNTPPDSNADDKGEAEIPTWDSDAAQFDIHIYNFSSRRFDLATAVRCKEKQSFIAESIIKRNRLTQYVYKNRTIRLTWKMQVATREESPKTPSTLFRVISDDRLGHDAAIGLGCFDDDDDEDEDDGNEEVGSGNLPNNFQQLALVPHPPAASTATSQQADFSAMRVDPSLFAANFWKHLNEASEQDGQSQAKLQDQHGWKKPRQPCPNTFRPKRQAQPAELDDASGEPTARKRSKPSHQE